MNAPARVAAWPSGLVTCTACAPAAPAGVTARTCVADRNVTPVAATPLTRTVAPDTNAAPVSVMVVPPLVGPEVGEMDVRPGAATIGVGAAQRAGLTVGFVTCTA